MPDNPVVMLEGVSKRYKDHVAVERIDLEIPKGAIYGMLGPNGAGKSTTLRMMLDIIDRDSGRIAILGRDPAQDRSILRQVGYLPEERGLYKQMSVTDVLVFFARLQGVSARTARADAHRWLERLGLAKCRDSKVHELSKGMQQKVQFITAVIHRPALIVLDEPMSGLDPSNQDVMRDAIIEVRNSGCTVMLSTHNLAQAEDLCEYVCVIGSGRKLIDGTLKAIKSRYVSRRYTVRFERELSDADLAKLRECSLSAKIGENHAIDVELNQDMNVADAIAVLNSLSVPIASFTPLQASLHNIFIQLTGAALPAALQPEPADV